MSFPLACFVLVRAPSIFLPYQNCSWCFSHMSVKILASSMYNIPMAMGPAGCCKYPLVWGNNVQMSHKRIVRVLKFPVDVSNSVEETLQRYEKVHADGGVHALSTW